MVPSVRLSRKIFRVSQFSSGGAVTHSLQGPFGTVSLNGSVSSVVSLPPSTFFFSRSSALSLLASIRCVSNGLGYGYYARLALSGVGFRVWNFGRLLLFDLGFNTFHAYSLPVGVFASVGKANLLLVAVDSLLLATVADQLCSLRFPDVYKGKGILLGDAPPTLKKRKRDGK